MLDVIICANFGVKKLRGLENTRGQILEYCIEMAGHPYNSAALPRSLSWQHQIAQTRKYGGRCKQRAVIFYGAEL